MRFPIAAALLVFATAASAQEAKPSPRIMGGYVSGREYMDMDGLEKSAYVRGLFDGIFLAPAFGAKNEDVDWLLACTGQVGIDEFRRYMFEHIRQRDDLWANRSPAKMYRAVRDLCQAKAKAP